MRNFITILSLFTFLSLSAQNKDSLSKHTVNKLIKITEETWYSNNDGVKTYTDELLRRKLSDSARAFTYDLMASFEYKSTKTNLFYYREAVKYAKKSGSPNLIRETLGDLGEFYAFNNDYNLAIECTEEIKQIEESGFKLDYPLPRVARIYSLMGDFKRSNSLYLKEVKKIKDYQARTYNIGKEEAEKLRLLERSAYSYLVSGYTYQKKLDSAAYYLEKAKILSPLKGNYLFTHDLWYHESFLFIVNAQYDKAVARIKQSEDFIKTSRNNIYRSQYYLAVCYLGKEEFKKALEYAELALTNKTESFSFINIELELYKIAGECAEKVGNISKANFYLKKYLQLSQKTDYEKKAAFV